MVMKRIFLFALVAASSGFIAQALAQPLLGGNPLVMLGRAKSELSLNTSQQQQWDNVVAQTKAARDAGRANFGELKAALQAELAKPEPDFAAVAAVADNVRARNEALRTQTRNAWLGLYATFTPEQKAVARDAINAGIARMQQRRAMHGGPTPGNY
jgi:Spy/CpxP family protein refolding chaperone